MNHNSWESNALDEMQIFYARAYQPQAPGSQEVTGAPAMQSDTSGKDFAHPSCPNLSDFSDIRSWAVQPSHSFWRNPQPDNEMQSVELSEDVENHSAQPEVAGVSKFIRWIRFNAVGALGIAVQMVALFVLKSVLHLNYLVATAFAVEAAVVHNFVWHERFTWVDRVRAAAHGAARRMLRFNLTTGGVSIVLNLVLMKLLAGMAHMNYFLANIIAIALCSLANFVASDEWVFEEKV
jgi:putative flippase GtrA